MRGSTALVLGCLGALGYKLTVEGSLTLDTGWGRRMRPLGCPAVDVAAPRDVVFDVLAAPYGERRPRAFAEKVEVLERGNDMVLAAHRTHLGAGRVATTVETVRFTRPARIDFRLVRGPVPHVAESFLLTDVEDGTRIEYRGELGTDLWGAGQWWGDRVGAVWEATVRASLAAAKQEAERRTLFPS
jgi:Polyketide cyclase / dehydrase and lipid transport